MRGFILVQETISHLNMDVGGKGENPVPDFPFLNAEKRRKFVEFEKKMLCECVLVFGVDQ